MTKDHQTKRFCQEQKIRSDVFTTGSGREEEGMKAPLHSAANTGVDFIMCSRFREYEE